MPDMDKWRKRFFNEIPLKSVSVGTNLSAEYCVVDQYKLWEFISTRMREYAVEQLKRVKVHVEGVNLVPLSENMTGRILSNVDDLIKENTV